MRFSVIGFWLPVLALAAMNVLPQQFYVERSRAVTPGSFAEVPLISNTHVLRFLKDRRTRWPDTVFTDSFNHSAARIQAYFVNPSRIIYLSSDHYDSFGSTLAFCGGGQRCLFAAPRSLFNAADARIARREKFFRNLDFDFGRGLTHPLPDAFFYDERAKDIASIAGSQIIESAHESILNRWPGVSYSAGDLYTVKRLAESTNHLVYVPGSLGGEVGFGNSSRIGLYSQEVDPYYSGQSVAAIGRYLLFRVIAPSPRLRFELSVSASFKGDGYAKLSQARIVGERSMSLPLVGRGSARVFSDVVTPQKVDGMAFLGLDMGVNQVPITEPPRSGLMRLYGKDVRLDARDITLFSRDLSVVDDRTYRSLQRPQHVQRLPEDLADPSLEYSGVYEDGWISEDSYFVLHSTRRYSTFRLRGFVPLIANPHFQTRVCVRLDSVDAGCRTVGLGNFTFAYRLKPADSDHAVRIRFEEYQILRYTDHRPIAMKLQFVGFGPTSLSRY